MLGADAPENHPHLSLISRPELTARQPSVMRKGRA
jgi:hypothetical protein